MAVLTISRQFGAGGLTLGKMVAERMGYTLFDNEIIQMVAKRGKVSANWVEQVEKEAGGKFQKFVSSLVPKGLVNRVITDEHGYIDEEIYVDILNEIILKIAEEDNAIILGRGAQYILGERPETYHVLLIAEKADRVRFMEDRYNMSNKKAVTKVNNEDRRRTNLYRKFGRTDYDNPLLYHMTLNTSILELNQACYLMTQLIMGEKCDAP